MKAYKRLCISVITAFLLLMVVLNLFLVGAKDSNEGIYRVEAKRLADEIAETGNYDLEKYPHITEVFKADDGELYLSDEHYLIIEADGMLYRVEYTVGKRTAQHCGGKLCILCAACADGRSFVLYPEAYHRAVRQAERCSTGTCKGQSCCSDTRGKKPFLRKIHMGCEPPA